MIPERAVKEYLSYPRADHRWLKRKTASAVEALLNEQYPQLEHWPNLKLHQKVCIYLGLRFPRFSFWADMGSGKTLISLELLRYWWDQGHIRRALVFVVSDKAFSTWERQIKLYGIGIPFVALDSTSSEGKWEQLDNFGDGIILLHYPGTVAMVSNRVSNGSKNKMMLSGEKVDRLSEEVDALVFDESTKCGHYNSLTTQLARWLATRVDICYALSGRPFGRDPTMLWNQQYIIDQGASLGTTLGIFRAAFFTATTNYWARMRGGRAGAHVMDWKFIKKKMPELTRLAQHRSITYRAAECIDLPPLVAEIETVLLPQEASAYYARVVRQVIEAKGNYSEMKNAFVRMRQLSSGFLGFRDDDTDERVEIAFDVNPKLDRLMELIEAIPEDRGAVVFYEFTHSGRRISEELRKRDIDHIWLWSGTKDSRGELARFTEGRCPIAVVQSKVGAYSLDGLQIANYLFFYESPVSVIDRDQAAHRLLRQGQTRHVFQYDLTALGTLDQKILDYHREGQKLFDVLTKNPEAILEITKKFTDTAKKEFAVSGV